MARDQSCCFCSCSRRRYWKSLNFSGVQALPCCFGEDQARRRQVRDQELVEPDERDHCLSVWLLRQQLQRVQVV